MLAISSDVIRGYNDTMILFLLLEGPSYGYELSKKIKEMSEGNQAILAQIDRLKNVTQMINSSMSEMSIGANKINENGKTLTEISTNMNDSIEKIGSQIDLFRV